VTVKGLSHSRPTSELEAVDLTDPAKTLQAFAEFSPEWVIHCAAERRPDVAEKNPDATRLLNGEVPRRLAALSTGESVQVKPFTLIYISTDYVFDGTAAPYEVDAKPHPVQFYGETKLAGEEAVLGTTSERGRRIVLRVPLLYGPVRVNSDSAVNVLLDVVRDQSGKTYTMDHWATRYPTNVEDIASFLVRLQERHGTIAKLPSILHYSSSEPYTKYEMCLLLASLHSPPLAHAHIKADASEPVVPPGGVGRPKDCQLSTAVIESAVSMGGLGMELEPQLFEDWWRAELGKKALM